jgi:UDP-3-O-[3-hydroxymyristoyl] N-acetylglucosamine deacetylase / 3-hydroxyacyl-[acyl-carrier-protein] dehydratase
MDKQRTVARELSLSGIGLHTAKKVNLTFKPAAVDSGISFVRADLPGRPLIKASCENLLSSAQSLRRTSIGTQGLEVQTIEHLMAALAGLGIDNIAIDVDNEEVPGLDGSSYNFLELLFDAGIKEQDKERAYYFVKEPVFAEEDGSTIIALPSNEFRISYTLSYKHPMLKADFMELSITPDTFKNEISRARTFCLESEVNELQHQGIGRGANYTNTLVLGEKGVIRNELRYKDEFIRHKILDLMGDLNLLGSPLKAHIIALRSGHSLNLKLVKKIGQQRSRTFAGGIGSGLQTKLEGELDLTMIKRILPHREPFLFVDKVIHLEQGKHCVGIKNVTINDYFFKGHFPGKPVMPGVLIVEALAQVGGVMMLSPAENRGKIAFFMSANNIKFRKPVVPGDQLVLDVLAGRIKARTGTVHGKAMVDGKLVAEADLAFVLADTQ